MIGLGEVGKNILSSLKKNEIVLIDETSHEGFETVIIEPGKEGQYKHERYDQVDLSEANLERFRDRQKYFVVSGGSDISGASLRLLEALGGSETSVIYIKPEKDSLTNIQVMQERLTRGILQESARSGMIKEIILFDNDHIASFSGNVSIKNYYPTINNHITYAINALIFCEENSQVFGKKRDYEELNRIVTLGRVHENQEILFFPLRNEKKETQYPLSKTYCYLVPSEQLEDVDLLSSVRREISNINLGNIEEVNFGIYETSSETEYKMVIIETSLVQE